MIAKIHPFMDGNGRTARMVQDFGLLADRLLPVGIPISRRGEYYDSLEASDNGDLLPLIGLVANAELAALDKARRIAEAPGHRRKRILRLVKAASHNVKKTEYNQYEVWRRKVDGFMTEFTKWLDELNEESEEFQFRYRTYEMKSFEKWCEVRDNGWAPATWLLLIDVIVRGKSAHKFLFYAKRHHLNWVTDPTDELRDTVAIFSTPCQTRTQSLS